MTLQGHIHMCMENKINLLSGFQVMTCTWVLIKLLVEKKGGMRSQVLQIGTSNRSI